MCYSISVIILMHINTSKWHGEGREGMKTLCILVNYFTFNLQQLLYLERIIRPFDADHKRFAAAVFGKPYSRFSERVADRRNAGERRIVVDDGDVPSYHRSLITANL